MTLYRILANGTDMGAYEGSDPEAALDAYAQDAGYTNYDDLLARVPGSSREEAEIVEEAQHDTN
jgi:hypothetical protein